jgi:hypothetical protein
MLLRWGRNAGGEEKRSDIFDSVQPPSTDLPAKCVAVARYIFQDYYPSHQILTYNILRGEVDI